MILRVAIAAAIDSASRLQATVGDEALRVEARYDATLEAWRHIVDLNLTSADTRPPFLHFLAAIPRVKLSMRFVPTSVRPPKGGSPMRTRTGSPAMQPKQPREEYLG